jgi:hypothetical protein
MASIKLSMRGFAEISCAKPSQKRSKLKQYKFPDSEDSVGRSNYYVKALSAIKRHHKGQSSNVNSVLQNLMIEAATETDPRKKAKLLNNRRAIIDYLQTFGRRQLTIKPGKSLHYVFKDVLISAHPDLVAEENGSLVLIKLNLGKNDFGGGVCAFLLHVLYKAAHDQGLPIKPSCVECLQTCSGTRVVGPRNGFPSDSVLKSACQEIANIWAAA